MQQRDFPFSLFTFLLFLILIYPAIQDTFTKITHNSDISLSCPTTEVIEIGNMRNYVLRLMEAPKEASVSCFGDEAGEVTSECDLDKNKQLCVFRNFVTQLVCSCFDETQTLLLRVLEPEEVTELSISEQMQTQAILPILQPDRKGIVKFLPFKQFAKSIFPAVGPFRFDRLFLDNCVQYVDKFQDMLYFGIKGNQAMNCVLVIDEQIEGFWAFTKINTTIYHYANVLENYALQGQEITYTLGQLIEFRVLQLLLHTTILDNLSIEIKIQYNEMLGDDHSDRLVVKGKDLDPYKDSISFSKKIMLFSRDHPINQFSLRFTHNMYFSVRALSDTIPEIQDHELLLFTFDRKGKQLEVRGLIERNLHRHGGKVVRFSTKNVEKMKLFLLKQDEQKQLTMKKQNEIILQEENLFSPFYSLKFLIQPVISQKLRNSFQLFMQSPFKQVNLEIGEELQEVMSSNEQIKYFLVERSEIKKVEGEKLKLTCRGCHAFATYEDTCWRIDCCQHKYVTVFPKEDKKLRIMVNKLQTHKVDKVITLLLEAETNNYELQSGKSVHSFLQKGDLYVFKPSKESVEIICNSMLQSVIILVNEVNQKFPTLEQFQHQSSDGYLKLTLKTTTPTLRISVLKHQSLASYSKKIQYSIVGVESGGAIRLESGKAFADYYGRRSERRYALSAPCDFMGKIQASVSLRNPSPRGPANSLHVQFTNHQKTLDDDFNDFSHTQISSLFKNSPTGNKMMICQVEMTVSNPTNNNLRGTALLLSGGKIRSQILAGQFSTEVLAYNQTLHLYCVVLGDKDTNLYVYSYDKMMEISVKIVEVNSIKQVDKVQFPTNFTSSSFSHHHYQPATKTETEKQKVVLLSVRENHENMGDLLTSSRVHIICTQDKTRLRNNNKLFYYLPPQQQHQLYFEVGEEMVKDKSDLFEEVVMDSTEILGSYVVEVELRKGTTLLEKVTQAKGLRMMSQKLHPTIIVEMQPLKSTMQQIEEDEAHLLTLVFVVKCIKQGAGRCILLSSVHTSNSQIYEVMAGTPEMFHIGKHSVGIFVYNNEIDDGDFKFKINRKTGFPNYQLCSSKEDYRAEGNECLQQLQLSEREDQTIFEKDAFQLDNYVSGRSHQLAIQTNSQFYCTRCVYYLALYSRYDVVEGSIFVISNKQPLKLSQGDSITTIVYRREPDAYHVGSKQLYARIYVIEGSVDIELSSKSGVQPVIESVAANLYIVKYNGEGGYSVQVSTGANSPSALYSIICTNSHDESVIIKDGVPYKMKFKQPTLIKYQYQADNQATLLIQSMKLESIDITPRCLTAPSLPIEVRKTSVVGEKVDVILDPKICEEYSVQVLTKEPDTAYNLLVSSSDIITLPLGHQLATTLKYHTKLYQIYEITLNQRTDLKIILKFCQSGSGHIIISDDKKSIYKDETDFKQDISGNSNYEEYQLSRKPGVLYIKVEFKGLGGMLEYTIFVENAKKLDQETPLTVYQNRRSLNYKLLSIDGEKSIFQIYFYPVLLNLDLYDITYFLVESNEVALLERVSNCNGDFFTDIMNHHEQLTYTSLSLSEQYLSQQQVKMSPVSFQYSTTSPYNYITIIPIIRHENTHRPFHQDLPKYIVKELKNGEFSSSLKFKLKELAKFVQQYLDIHQSQETVLIVLVIVLIMSCLVVVGVGICIGARYFSRQKIVVLSEVNQEESNLREQGDHDVS